MRTSIKIKFKDYRQFKGEHELELRPITILIGYNNVGKSNLLELPLLEEHKINWGEVFYVKNGKCEPEMKTIMGAGAPTFEWFNERVKGDNRTNIYMSVSQYSAWNTIKASHSIPETKQLTIIEHPDANLHPKLHGEVAQRLAESYFEDNNRTYLIETHSQNFVLRMSRLVAEGKLNPNDLAIYYVQFNEDENYSSFRRIEVDALGRVAFWVDGFFNETLTETMAIRNAQLIRQVCVNKPKICDMTEYPENKKDS